MGMKRVPELVYMCNNKIFIFEEILMMKNIEKFIQNKHLGVKT
jgi:hypothetical protein